MAEDVAVASSATPSTGTPNATPNASSTPAPASATPASGSTPSAASTPAEPGPIPYGRFKEVNDQLKAAREFQQKYGWATQFERDPYGFVENWMDQLAEHQQYGPQLLGKVARMLQARRGQTAVTADEPPPDVPIVDGNGQVTGHTYSATRLKQWREWDWTQRQSALDQRIQPLEQMRTALEQQAQVIEIQRQADEGARATLTDLRQDPYFTQYEPKVKQALIDHPEWGDDVKGAYLHVLRTEVFPGIGQQAESRVLDSLKTQAAGGTPNPGMGATRQAPKFKDFGDALRYYAEHPDEARAMANR